MDLNRSLLTAVLLAAGSLAACGPGAYGYGYNVPPPPRAPYAGVYGVAPGPGYVWMDGYYNLHGDRWVWERGRWGRPPHGRRYWTPPRWERHGRHWSRHEGYWR